MSSTTYSVRLRPARNAFRWPNQGDGTGDSSESRRTVHDGLERSAPVHHRPDDGDALDISEPRAFIHCCDAGATHESSTVLSEAMSMKCSCEDTLTHTIAGPTPPKCARQDAVSYADVFSRARRSQQSLLGKSTRSSRQTGAICPAGASRTSGAAGETNGPRESSPSPR